MSGRTPLSDLYQQMVLAGEIVPVETPKRFRYPSAQVHVPSVTSANAFEGDANLTAQRGFEAGHRQEYSRHCAAVCNVGRDNRC